MRGSDVVLPPFGTAEAGTGYAVLPPGAKRGMVVIHEILGPQPEINAVVDRFAGRGYAALAPMLFTSMLRPACIRNAVLAMQHGSGPFVDRIRGAGEWLREQTGLTSPQVGLLGFCLGGGFALVAGPGWGAVSTNYGDVPKTELLQGIGPVIGCYGGRDRVFGTNAAKLKAALAPLGVEPETHTYPNVGHSFLTNGDHPIAGRLSYPLLRITYDPTTAEEGWKQILAFMDRHLVAAPLQ
jgi:carboxymethylenebutenolidase